MQAHENFFAGFEPIHTVGRDELVDAGDLIDVTSTAQAHGYRVPVAITVGVKNELDALAGRFGAGSWINLVDALIIVVRSVFAVRLCAGASELNTEFHFIGAAFQAVYDGDGVTILLKGED